MKFKPEQLFALNVKDIIAGCLSMIIPIQQHEIDNFFDRYEDAFVAEARSFINTVLHGDPLVSNGNDGLQAGLIARAAQQSHLEGRVVKITHSIE